MKSMQGREVRSLASMCSGCVYEGDDGFCVALAEDCEDVTDEDCDCFEPIMEADSDEG